MTATTRLRLTFWARRFLFALTVVTLVAAGTLMLIRTMDWNYANTLDWLIVPLFVVLFTQIVFGFTLSALGFLQGLGGRRDETDIMADLPEGVDLSRPLAPTAIVIPVYNEDIGRVLAGAENMWRGLERTGSQEHFDIFILSDSSRADCWVEEECAWLDLCRRLNAFGRIFYRKRRHALNRKSGNIADFCRRWGKRYRYMIVLDADSIMTGPLMTRLVQAMEANPRVGLIQTVPRMVLGASLLRRVMQFTMRLCGGIFSAGSHYWAGGASSFWGHNAIVRVAPFVKHCALPELPEKDPGKRRVLSHDTVEAALMRRAGYEVWLAYREDGSYEEGPPTLSDMLVRDRRWCQGNLQHFWFLFARRIHFANRLHILLGIMSYCSSLLWLTFLALSVWSAYLHFQQDTLRTALLVQNLEPARYTPLVSLLVLTLALLFIPKVMGLVSELPRAHLYGGAGKLTLSVLLEVILSVLLAPILMIFHSTFVIMTLLGLQVNWTTQNRTDDGLTLAQCARDYGLLTLLGIALMIACAWFLPSYLPWLLFICGPWALSIPLAWYTSRPSVGLAAAQAGLFVIPEETSPPAELEGLEGGEASAIVRHLKTESGSQPAPAAPLPGFVRALLDPYTNAIHLSLLRQREGAPRDVSPLNDTLERVSLLGLAEQSPTALSDATRNQLLWNGDSLQQLHGLLWMCPGTALHPDWRRAMAELAEAERA